ncbi:hypothetical protein KY345_04615 [Candidatus Woesearchaeota archaeon]|nr:hypothetical protein [Candidatus Woesearchaeota archaeon]
METSKKEDLNVRVEDSNVEYGRRARRTMARNYPILHTDDLGYDIGNDVRDQQDIYH